MANDKDFVVAGAVEVGKDTKVTLGSITSSDIDLSTGNYFAETLAADTTYTLSNAGDVQSFQLEVTGGVGDPYDISSAVYDGVSFSIAAQDSYPSGLFFKPDGTKMYVLGLNNDTVFQYTLSTAFDLSTASYDSVSILVNQDTSPYSLTFSSDGTKMYMLGNTNDRVFQYNLSTAYDISTTSYVGVFFNMSGQDNNALGLAFNNDGTKMYMAGNANDSIFQYSLSTGFDLSTASYDSVSLDVSGQDLAPADLTFNGDGTKMYVLGAANNSIFQYSLSTAFDISTASYDSVSFSPSGGSSSCAFNSDGTKIYVGDWSTDAIYQYSTTAIMTVTWPSSIEWKNGLAPLAPATGETDLYTFLTDDGGTSYVGLKTADNIS